MCRMLATNYLGAFCLTKVLLPLLENSPLPSRVVNVSSFTHRNGKILPFLLENVLFCFSLILFFLPVSCRQANRETVSGKFFTKFKDYPYAQIYEYSKCKCFISGVIPSPELIDKLLTIWLISFLPLTVCILLFSYELHRKVGLMKKAQHLSIV